MSNVSQFVDRKVQTLENKEINGGEASNQSRIILPKGTTSQLSALERKEGVIAFDTTLGQIVVDSGSAFVATSNPGDITAVNAGVGLDGGGSSGSVTLDLADTAVTPGSYTSADITVDAQGRITAAASGAGGVSSLSDDTQFIDWSTSGDGETADTNTGLRLRKVADSVTMTVFGEGGFTKNGTNNVFVPGVIPADYRPLNYVTANIHADVNGTKRWIFLIVYPNGSLDFWLDEAETVFTGGAVVSFPYGTGISWVYNQ